MQLKRHGFLTSATEQSSVLTYTARRETFKRTWEGEQSESEQTGLHFTIERYADGGEPGLFRQWEASGHMTLQYGVKRGDALVAPVQLEIAMVTTSPHYGGRRWWFLAPCCGKRVRILYIPVRGLTILPECRHCLSLNYPSQRLDYIERHKAYERYLLAHYGYHWASHEYHSLEHHSLKMTPQLERMKQASILKVELELLRHLIAFQQQMLRNYTRNLASLRSEEDRQIYVDFIAEQHGTDYALGLVRMLDLSIQVEKDAYIASPEVVQALAHEQTITETLMDVMDACEDDSQQEQPAKVPVVLELKDLINRKKAVEEELERLEQAA